MDAAFLQCVDGAMDRDARIDDGEFEEVMGKNMPVLPRSRNYIEWDCVCDVLGYEAVRDPVGNSSRISRMLGRM